LRIASFNRSDFSEVIALRGDMEIEQLKNEDKVTFRNPALFS
jgi:hypothetical protein